MKWIKFFLAAAAALLLADKLGVIGSAQTRRAPTQLPPLPVAERGFPRALAPVVGAEHAFAQHSIDHGMKPAFLSHAAPDGVIINRSGPVNAVATWSQRNPAPAGLLTWWPVYADVSRAGDLGWTTGPYEFREKPDDPAPADTGHFFTVWRRQSDATWKFVLDVGIRHAAPAAPETVLRYPRPPVKADAHATLKGPALDAALKSLEDEERKLSEDSSAKGARSALLARADESLRLYRQGAVPVVGREAVGRALKVQTEFMSFKPLKVDVALSGDLGYAYGTYEVRVKSSAGEASERGHYARVWKRERNGPWRVVFNLSSPAPPEGQ